MGAGVTLYSENEAIVCNSLEARQKETERSHGHPAKRFIRLKGENKKSY